MEEEEIDMLKFKVGDEITVGKIDPKFDESENEIVLIGHIGEIIEAVEGVYPYQVRFYNEYAQKINEEMGSRLFEESELNFL